MLIHDANEYAESIVIDDCSWRHVSLCHFKGTGTMTVNLNLAREKEFRVDRRTALELAYVFDHFARHQSFPDKNNRFAHLYPDFQI